MKALLLPALLLLLGALGAARADEDTCDGRCDAGFDAKKKCQCDILCIYYESCCTDYISVCKPKGTRGDVFVVPEDDYNYETFNDTTYTIQTDNENFVSHVTSSPEMQPTETEPVISASTTPANYDTIETTTAVEMVDVMTSLSPPNPETEEETAEIEEEEEEEALCSEKSFNAFTNLKNGSTYAFRGKYYYELDENSALEGYPKIIKDVWGIEGPIDAAFTRMNCQGKTYLFKGTKYWRFADGVLDSGYPREIADGFSNIPDSIDAAFAVPANDYRNNEKVYFFKGSRYWQYEFTKQPSQEECHGSAPSELFRRYTMLQMDSWENFFEILFGSRKTSGTKGPQYISSDWKGVPSAVDAVLPSRIYVPEQRRPSLRRSKRRKSRRRQNRKRKPSWAAWFYDTEEESLDSLFKDSEEDDPDWLPSPSKPRCNPIQSVYFFKKDKYYRVNLQTQRVDKVYPRYPRPIAQYWLGCKVTSKEKKSKY
ncbi:vitronectin [Ascaphus truei]|uniref:vitronectin n=1 Tax=Ascaphus truei TaxID=8439 RepID=UPI003F5963FD